MARAPRSTADHRNRGPLTARRSPVPICRSIGPAISHDRFRVAESGGRLMIKRDRTRSDELTRDPTSSHDIERDQSHRLIGDGHAPHARTTARAAPRRGRARRLPLCTTHSSTCHLSPRPPTVSAGQHRTPHWTDKLTGRSVSGLTWATSGPRRPNRTANPTSGSTTLCRSPLHPHATRAELPDGHLQRAVHAERLPPSGDSHPHPIHTA